MSCLDGVAANIASTCATQPSGGLEVTAYILNREDVAITYDVTNELLITGMVNAATKKAYSITGVKKLLNAGSDIVIADDRANKYSHYFNFQQFEFDSDAVLNVDNIDDVVIIVETRDETTDGDGMFRVYGAKFGLWKSTDTHRANDINGVRNLELTSLPGQEEPWSRYVFFDTDYATTLAEVVALLTPPA